MLMSLLEFTLYTSKANRLAVNNRASHQCAHKLLSGNLQTCVMWLTPLNKKSQANHLGNHNRVAKQYIDHLRHDKLSN